MSLSTTISPHDAVPVVKPAKTVTCFVCREPIVATCVDICSSCAVSLATLGLLDLYKIMLETKRDLVYALA